MDSLPLVVDFNSSRDGLLVCVDQGVDDGRQSWVIRSQRNGGDGGNGASQSLEQLALLNVQDLRAECVTLLVDLNNFHAVGEWGDVQHVQQCCLGSTDLGTRLDELQIRRNFDGTTSNLGWDSESLEERGLARFHTGVSGWDVDIGRCEGTSSSGGCDFVGEDLVSSFLEVAVREDEADVACVL